MSSCAIDNTIAQRLLQPMQARALLREALADRMADADSIRDVQIHRCWPGRRDSIKVELTFHWGNDHRGQLYGFWSADKKLRPIDAEPATTQRKSNDLSCVHRVLPRWNVRIFSPDCDETLRQIPMCLDGTTMARSLVEGGVVPPRTGAARAGWRVSLLAFKPGRRATMMMEDANGRGGNRRRFASKTFADDRGRELIDRHRAVSAQLAQMKTRVLVPAARGYIEPLKLAVFDWFHTPPAIATSSADHVEALTAMHRLSLSGLPQFTIADEIAIVQQWQHVMCRLRPMLAQVAQPMVEAAARIAESIDARQCCVVHRDFYDRQVLTDGRHLAVCDLDTLATGPAAVDLGNFAAHDILNGLIASRRPSIDSTLTPIIEAYRRFSPSMDARAVAFFCATSLLRVGAVHALRTATRRFTKPLWQRAAKLLGRLEGDGGER